MLLPGQDKLLPSNTDKNPHQELGNHRALLPVIEWRTSPIDPVVNRATLI